MIIQGLIETNKGPIDIRDLKVGDCVLNQMHRAYPITTIEKVEVTGGVTFKKNKALVVAKNTVVRTLYGQTILTGKKNIIITMVQPNMREIRDVAIPIAGNFQAYNIKVDDGAEVFANNYCIEMENGYA